MIDDVLYKQLLITDKTILETVSKATDKFIDIFITAFLMLRKLIKKKKEQFLYYRKKNGESLKVGEFLVKGDF